MATSVELASTLSCSVNPTPLPPSTCWIQMATPCVSPRLKRRRCVTVKCRNDWCGVERCAQAQLGDVVCMCVCVSHSLWKEMRGCTGLTQPYILVKYNILFTSSCRPLRAACAPKYVVRGERSAFTSVPGGWLQPLSSLVSSALHTSVARWCLSASATPGRCLRSPHPNVTTRSLHHEWQRRAACCPSGCRTRDFITAGRRAAAAHRPTAPRVPHG